MANLRGQSDSARALRSGVSFIAICAFAASTPAFAQSTQESTHDRRRPGASNSTSAAEPIASAIIITGIRGSLRSAQNVKRNSDTVVDVITAQDIGNLGDRSVTEALQRVPGVSINRFAGSSDPDHFSAEGSGVVVRGLTYVRSEFNGRDTFSTGVNGQAINFQDVPAELLGSVEVFKETTADRIEGGLSGTINMNLRLPFDNKGLHIGYDARSQLRRSSQEMVAGRIGAGQRQLGHGHRPHRPARRVLLFAALTRADGVQVSNFQTRDGTYSNNNHPAPATGICRSPLPSDTDTTGFPPIIHATRGPGLLRASAPTPAGAERLLRLCRHALCADRRPVPHPELRPQAPRLCRGCAMGEPRPACASHRPVPAFARERELGRTHVRELAPTFRNTIPSRWLSAEQRRLRRPARWRSARSASGRQPFFGANGGQLARLSERDDLPQLSV